MEVTNYPEYIKEHAAEYYGITNPIDDPGLPFKGTITYDIGRLKNCNFFFGTYVELTNVPDYEGEVAAFEFEPLMLEKLRELGNQPDNEFDLTPEIVEELLAGYKDL